MKYYFEWDIQKAKNNLKKHGVSFEQASAIMLDPGAISIFDAAHSEDEDRWVTIGIDGKGLLTVLIHTFLNIDKDSCRVRIISARRATRNETVQYRKGNK